MKQLIILLILLVKIPLFGQVSLSGVWQGVIFKNGESPEKGMPVYLEITISGKTFTGKMRDELYETDAFAVKKIKGTTSENTIDFNEFVVEKKKSKAGTSWCLLQGKLEYNSTTGYLTGNYSSKDCRTNYGKIILYKSKLKFSATETSPASQIWFQPFIKDYKAGYNAPDIREEERKNFHFEPIYFEHDKADLNPEYYEFLRSMIRVVNGHSDLRIKVTGHTDSDGSDSYNIDLSKRRAQALIDFFVANGLARDRIEIDFKGESQPVDTNKTPEGKQHNRRVDFSFI